MMPYIQGEPETVPPEYLAGYADVLSSVFVKKGDIGFLTIDESWVEQGKPHRGARSKWDRALHTEAGRHPDTVYAWGGSGGGTWGGTRRVTLERDVKVLLANSLDRSCAIWEVEHENTSIDGDIGNFAEQYPYSEATLMPAGEVHEIGIFTPHESLPVIHSTNRQFLRIISSGVHGREPYFTENRLLKNAT